MLRLVNNFIFDSESLISFFSFLDNIEKIDYDDSIYIIYTYFIDKDTLNINVKTTIFECKLSHEEIKIIRYHLVNSLIKIFESYPPNNINLSNYNYLLNYKKHINKKN